ncbi:hypothetical protein QYE76_060410 [Lolium multiflorum]|uniref:Uncharacterized protein n=1 Tax=Lolium multiflorum TaxID=4521 RepID=A0AAD8W5C5_LOLMU|nr:uncharacterized protein LOC127291920 isoform X1 [Lolium perenne]KAK1642605.1 hypothetical protein QYE76_060410 [Lolium multiflorum]
MAGLPPLLPTPPASLKLRDTAVESRAPKRHRPLEPPASDSRRPQPASPPSSRRRTGELPPPPKSKVRRRSRSPPSFSVRRRSRSPPPCKHPETSSATVVNRPDPAIRGHEQKLDSKKMDGKNQSDGKAPSRSARRKKIKRQIRAEAKKEFREHSETSSGAVEKTPDPAVRGDELELHSEKMDGKNQSDHKAPSRSARRKKMRRQVWTEAKKQMREMKKDKLLEKIKKLQDCAWLLEKDGADKAEIMEFRSLIESTKKQYGENEELLAQAGSSASQQVLNNDRLDKTHVETMAALVETVEGDEQNMDSGEAEGRSLKGCKEASKQSELAEEVNRLKNEIETVRQDRDYQSAKAQSLMADMAKQKEVARRYGVELEDAMSRVAALEERGLLESETIRTLQVQLACANEKLMLVSSTARD